jgi:HK97 family phage prohead protease
MGHDSNKILARSKYGKGTLTLGIDGKGLRYSFTAPSSTIGNDLVESLKRGDIDQSSFGFIVEKDNWITEGNVRIRQIVKIKTLLDISPVVYPAYVEATSQVRSTPVKSKVCNFAAIHARRAKLLR